MKGLPDEVKFYVKMQQPLTLDVAIAIVGNWEIAKRSSSFGSIAMTHFMSPSSLMLVNRIVAQPYAHLNNPMWPNPSAIHGVTMPMVQNSLPTMQASETTTTTFPSAVQPFNVPYATFGALGSNLNPLVTNTFVAHYMQAMPSMLQMTSVPPTSTFSSMLVQPIGTQSPIALVLPTTIQQYSSLSTRPPTDAKEERMEVLLKQL